MAYGESYDDFVLKFSKPRPKTTDECYTPPEVYDAVKAWAIKEYHLEGRPIIRPFWPDTDYRKWDAYPDGCVVIDNPPFSCITQVVRDYQEHNIDFFLFAPALTLFSVAAGAAKYVVSNTKITYENGAVVNTGFVTSLGRWKVHCSSTLLAVIRQAQAQREPKPKKTHDPHVLTSATALKFAKDDMCFLEDEVQFVRTTGGEKVFGGAFLCGVPVEPEHPVGIPLTDIEQGIVARLAYTMEKRRMQNDP